VLAWSDGITNNFMPKTPHITLFPDSHAVVGVARWPVAMGHQQLHGDNLLKMRWV
jgi:hypothetical protein